VAGFPTGTKVAFAISFTRRTDRSSRLPGPVRVMVILTLLRWEKVLLTVATRTGLWFLTCASLGTWYHEIQKSPALGAVQVNE
jgi:hypothetical protein